VRRAAVRGVQRLHLKFQVVQMLPQVVRRGGWGGLGGGRGSLSASLGFGMGLLMHDLPRFDITGIRMDGQHRARASRQA
jgi:hypothetical protein